MHRQPRPERLVGQDEVEFMASELAHKIFDHPVFAADQLYGVSDGKRRLEQTLGPVAVRTSFLPTRSNNFSQGTVMTDQAITLNTGAP